MCDHRWVRMLVSSTSYDGGPLTDLAGGPSLCVSLCDKCYLAHFFLGKHLIGVLAEDGGEE